MMEASSQPDQIPAVPQQADLELYRTLLLRYNGAHGAAYRHAERVKGRVLGHRGAASPSELRGLWELHHPYGPSGRQVAPDDFALLFAAGKHTAEDLAERCGMSPQWLEAQQVKFQLERRELDQYRFNAQLFDQAALSELIRARLPGMLMKAETPLDWQRVLNSVRRLPDWVWADPHPAQAAPAASAPLAGPVASPACPAPPAAPSDRPGTARKRHRAPAQPALPPGRSVSSSSLPVYNDDAALAQASPRHVASED